MKQWLIILICGLLAAAAGFQQVKPAQVRPLPEAATPPELVATYSNLADSILATKAAEASLVRSIVAMTFRHAEGLMARIEDKLQEGKKARREIETLADLVAQLGNEGDASVAGIRKRLLDAGHHHHAGGEEQGIYDEGFVIVTKKARKALLEVAKKIGQMASAPDAPMLTEAWNEVIQISASLLKEQ